MSDNKWIGITKGASSIGVSLSLSSNFLLLLFIHILPINVLGSYRHLMITFSVFSLFYISVETFLQPLVHIHDDTCFIIQQKRFDYSHTVARAISSLYCGCLAASFTLFSVHFIYRYFAVCKPKNLHFFTGEYWFLWFFGVFGTALSWSAFAFFCFPGSERTTKSFRTMVEDSYKLSPQTTDYVAYTYWNYEKGVRRIDCISLIGVAHHFVVMFVSFAIVFYCGILTVIEMRKAQVTSSNTKKLQSQLFKALVVQTAFPTFFIYIPTLIVFLAPVFNLELGGYGNLAIVTIHLYPGVDPLILLLVISDFRKAIQKTPKKAFELTTQVFNRNATETFS